MVVPGTCEGRVEGEPQGFSVARADAANYGSNPSDFPKGISSSRLRWGFPLYYFSVLFYPPGDPPRIVLIRATKNFQIQEHLAPLKIASLCICPVGDNSDK